MPGRFVPPRRLLRGLVGATAVALVGGACHRDAAPIEARMDVQRPERAGERLEREVRARLYETPQLSGAGSIVVIVDSGHVVLEGWVASAAERTLAEATAGTVAGVASVDDRLLVRPSGAWR